jgi:ABC-type sugar transport system ATPase subunit
MLPNSRDHSAMGVFRVEGGVTTPLLAARGLSKSYGLTEVLSGVDFTLHPGEAVAVIGENGAGKSTFAKIIAGVIRPDSGSMLFQGGEVHFSSPPGPVASA